MTESFFRAITEKFSSEFEYEGKELNDFMEFKSLITEHLRDFDEKKKNSKQSEFKLKSRNQDFSVLKLKMKPSKLPLFK